MKKTDVSLIILSCDKYSDYWHPFFSLKEKYWEDCPYETYLVTETKGCNYSKTININNSSWTYRFREALKEVKTKYVMVMLEDFFIREKVKQVAIDKIEFDENIACFNFEKRFKLECETKKVGDFIKRKNNTPYLNSSQPSLHDREKLIERLQKDQNPWEWELTRVDSEHEFYVNNGDLIVNIGYNHTLNWGVSRGEMTDECRDFLLKEGFNTNKLELFSAWYPVGNDKSYISGQVPKYIKWIKEKTKINVYPGESMYGVQDNELSYGVLLEPRVAFPELYKAIEDGLYKKFKYIFTCDKGLLELPNAKFMTLGGQWYGTYSGEGKLDKERYKKKTKNIATICSDKVALPMHKIRNEITKVLDKGKKVDCFGTFKGEYAKQVDALDDYRYSIMIEPDVAEDWFTERLENCFGAMTVPIYWGCTNIEKYFNTDGIIQVNSEEELYAAIKKCNVTDYKSRIEAMKDNYDRALKYKCYEDVLYENYKDLIEADYYDESKTLSIVIPMYNTTKLTRKLLDVLMPQLNNRVEVIIINDGSTEDITPITKFPVKIINTKNQGVSAARNTGLNEYVGENLVFIDSDDDIPPYYIEKALHKIDTEEFDYCLMSWRGIGRIKGDFIIKGEAPSWNDSIWNCIYKRETIGDTRFDTGLQIGEDAVFNKKVRKGKRANIEDIMYYYMCDREDSLTRRYAKREITEQFVEEVETKEYLPIEKETGLLIYQKAVSGIGGVETFIDEFLKEFYDKIDITFVYSTIDEKQLDRYRKLVKCVRFEKQTFNCQKYLCVSNQANIADHVNSSHNFYGDMIHADFNKMKWRHKGHKKTTHFVAVSEVAKAGFTGQTDRPIEVIYNLLNIEKPKRVLKLISPTRLSWEKGQARMDKLAERLDELKIPFVWQVFTYDVPSKVVDGFVYRKPTLDVRDYINDSDYLVQLSDTESWGYSTAEAMEQGVPVICTNYPAIHEQGFKEGKTGFILEQDMSNLDDVIEKAYNTKLKKFKYEKKDDPEQWINLLGELSPPDNEWMTYQRKYLVQAIRDFDDTMDRTPDGAMIHKNMTSSPWLIDEARKEFLVKNSAIKILKIILQKKQDTE